MPQVISTQQGGGGVSRGDLADCTSAPVFGNGTIGTTLLFGTTGVIGLADACPGVFGSAQSGDGVDGSSVDGVGVYGNSMNNAGVHGVSGYYWGVLGQGQGGVLGRGGGTGVWGQGNSEGVRGSSGNSGATPDSVCGVWGDSRDGSGVYGTSANLDGVHGVSRSSQHAGVSAINDTGGSTAFGLWARGSPAGHFVGDVEITGDLTQVGNITMSPGGNITLNGGIVNLTNNGDIQFSDCAEDFDVVSAGKAEPGTVMVIDDAGVLRPAERPYDKRVAGVISGAGNCRPAIVLNRQHTKLERAPLALFGTVYCKVDGQYGPIDVGDLLTTSPTLGHGMKAADPLKAFGAVIGKALRALEAGKGLIPVLVSLQ